MMCAGDIHSAWKKLPVGSLATVGGTGRVLVLAPHPDDESLGCGGLIAALCDAKQPPLVVVLTDGTGSHKRSDALSGRKLRDLREAEARAALRLLGLDDPAALIFMRLRDTAAPHQGPAFEDAVHRIAKLADRCATICAPWEHDPHCDHVAAHLIAQAVAARTGIRHLAFPVWGWTLPADTALAAQKVAGWRLDVAAYLQAKQAAIAAHRSQHGSVISDDPEGFVLPHELLRVFRRPYEVFLVP
jgi:LmbE family N-acetylglucosaminyl deacetylase